MPTPEYIERRLNELQAMWDTPEIYKQRSRLSQQLIGQIEAERNGEKAAPKTGGPTPPNKHKEVPKMTINFRSSPDNAPIHLDVESDPATRGYQVLRIPRPPMKNVSSTGVDVVRVKDIGGFLRDKLKNSVKYEGTTRATDVLSHYVGVFRQARVFDDRTMKDMESMVSTLKTTPTHEGRAEFFSKKSGSVLQGNVHDNDGGVVTQFENQTESLPTSSYAFGSGTLTGQTHLEIIHI
jgi:hypothetical protein